MRRVYLLGIGALSMLTASLGAAGAATVFSDNAVDPHGEYRGVSSLIVSFDSSGGPNEISFDLFGARSIEGAGSGYKDRFTVALDGIDVFIGNFNMSGGGVSEVTKSLLGWTWNTVTNPGGNAEGGVTHVAGLADLVDGANYFIVSFASPGKLNGPDRDQGTADESWALNNLDVSPAAVPLPAGVALLGSALAGLLSLRRHKQK